METPDERQSAPGQPDEGERDGAAQPVGGDIVGPDLGEKPVRSPDDHEPDPDEADE